MDSPFPPGVYEVEVDQEPLDTMSSLHYRRTATRIRLPAPGLLQLLTIDQKHLDAALAADSSDSPAAPKRAAQTNTA
jgi:hypothetical protein